MLARLLEQRRLVMVSAVLLALLGVVSFLIMPRQEDPDMSSSFGLIVAPFPGADAAKVERLILDPLEEHLAEVEDIKRISATARAEVAVVQIELEDGVGDLEASWDEVEKSLRKARSDLPNGAPTPRLDRDLLATESIVFAVTGGTEDRLALARAAKRLKKELLRSPGVARVELTGAPREHVRISYDDAQARRYGLNPQVLASQLASRNTAVPGGTVRTGERRTTLRPEAEFRTVEEIASTPVLLPSGTNLALEEVADVRLAVGEPDLERMRHQGHAAVGVGVVPKKGIHLVRFGEEIRNRVAAFESKIAPLTIEEVVYQPARVEERLSGLTGSLLLGIGIVAGVLILFMGLRLGLVVACVVPLVAATSLGIYGMSGGVLQQISVAALVLALGMLVDNAIVVAESVQRRLDQGKSRAEAVRESVRELALPLGAATGTTLAAFVPMLMAEGPTAQFTRSIPIIVMLTLTVSYVFAVLFTPLLGGMVQRPGRAGANEGRMAAPATLPWVATPAAPHHGRRPAGRIAHALGRLATQRRKTILAGAIVLIVGSGLGAGLVEQRFFPASDRNQLIVSVELPEGAHLDAIDARARRIEAALARRSDVDTVTTFVGRATPKFYYNLLDRPQSSHLAQILVTTHHKNDVGPVLAFARDYVANELPELEMIARPLEQGPPVNAPIEVRLYGDDLDELKRAADGVMGELRRIPGTQDVRHNLGTGVSSLRFLVDDAAANRHGISRNDVSLALLGRTRGLEVGKLRDGSDLIPIVIAASTGEHLPAEDLPSVDVNAPGRPPVPLAEVARTEVAWQPAVIHHYQRRRAVTVASELAEDVPFSRVLATFDARASELDLGPEIEIAYGGAKEGSGEANTAMLRTLPVGILLLLFILLAEFNSFRRVGIVLVTVPLAATGVIPGLLLAGQPFGFMSMLGVFALIGVVVNNAIILLDLTERLRAEGKTVSEAVQESVRQRTRPILLTTGTTVAGLLPLALSDTTLWPPLAWAMISGLLASTGLTLLVVPALYGLLFPEPKNPSQEGRASSLVRKIRELARFRSHEPEPGV